MDRSDSKQKIIPRMATVFVAPIESFNIAKNIKYIRYDRRQNFINFNFNLRSKNEEPYDSENLKSLEFKLLSQPVEIFNIDFNDQDNIQDHLEGRNDRDRTLILEEDGYLDALAVWFDLYLNRTEIITTSPVSELEYCWEQALFPIGKNNPVKKGDRLSFVISSAEGILHLANCKLNGSSVNDDSVEVSKDIVKFLNSQSTLCGLELFFKSLGGKLNSDRKLVVLDTFIYPYVGFKLFENRVVDLVSFYIYDCDIAFLKSRARQREGNGSRYYAYSYDAVAKVIDELNLDLIILDLFSSNGELNETLMTLYPSIK